MSPRAFVLVTYDIPDDKRRLRVAKLMLRFGDRVQYSVFECNLKEEEISVMVKKLQKEVDTRQDSIRIYRLCKGCVSGVKIIGLGEVRKELDLVIV